MSKYIGFVVGCFFLGLALYDLFYTKSGKFELYCAFTALFFVEFRVSVLEEKIKRLQ